MIIFVLSYAKKTTTKTTNYLVYSCPTLSSEKKRQHRQQRQQFNKKSCFTLSSKKNDNKDNKLPYLVEP